MRRVRLILDGLQVKSIRWRMPTSRHEGLRECMQKYDPCVYCGKPAAKHFTWEHIQPRAQGGAWGWENMARACRKCNKNRDQLPFLLFMVLKRESSPLQERTLRRLHRQTQHVGEPASAGVSVPRVQ